MRPLLVVVLVAACGGADTTPLADAGNDVALDGRADADIAEAAGAAETEPDPSCTGVCNAVPPSNPSVTAQGGRGNITMYTTEPSSGGACNYGSTAVAYFAAINVNVVPGDGRGQWNGGRICGQCAEVTAVTSVGRRSVVVRVMDRCADAACGMDLGGAAPAAVMADGPGRYDGGWRFVSCDGHPEVSDGPPSLHVVAGSNAWWSRVQVRNPPWAVADLAWQDASGGSGSFPWATDPENTFEAPAAVLQSSASTLRVTVRYGDGGSASVRLAPAALALPDSDYPLP